jgi:hypothetical protein
MAVTARSESEENRIILSSCDAFMEGSLGLAVKIRSLRHVTDQFIMLAVSNSPHFLFKKDKIINTNRKMNYDISMECVISDLRYGTDFEIMRPGD